MTEEEDESPRKHEYSSGQGFDDPYEGFDLDPPELSVDPSQVDPVDSRVVADLLDREAIADDAVSAQELIDVGLSYMQIERAEQAADAFQRAAQFADDPVDAQEAWVNKGVAHAQLEEWDEAIGAYQEALSIDETGPFAAEAETNLAFARWEFGQSEQALEHAERAVSIDERFPQAWFNRGYFLLERGLAEDALNSFENAIRLGMSGAQVHEEKARALEELGEDELAEEAAQKAEEIRMEQEQSMLQQ